VTFIDLEDSFILLRTNVIIAVRIRVEHTAVFKANNCWRSFIIM